jgi:hypothetical protein
MKNSIKFFIFISLTSSLYGILWVSASCSDPNDLGPIPGPTKGAVNVKIDLDNLNQSASVPSLFKGGGACFDRTILFNGTINSLCKSSSSPLNYRVSTPSVGFLLSDDVRLIVKVVGSGSFVESRIYDDTEIITDANNNCVVVVAAPINESSTITVALTDVCCKNSNRRLEWKSQAGDQNLSLSSSVPKTRTEIDNGQKVVTRTAKLIPINELPSTCN